MVLIFGTIFSSFATANGESDLSVIHKAEIENQFDQMILSLKNDGKLDIAKLYIDLDGVNGLVTGTSGIDGKGVLDTFVSGTAERTDKFSFDLNPLFENGDNVRTNLPVNPGINACYQDIYTACTIVKFETLLF